MIPASNPSSLFSLPRLLRTQRSTFLMLAAFVAVSACEEDEPTTPPQARTVAVTPRVASVVSGQTVQLAAEARDASGAAMSGGTVVWKSLDTLVARVNSSGLVTVLSSGSTAITATVLGATGFGTIDAIGVTAAVVITGTTTGTVPIGQSLQLSASAREANGRALFKPVTWSSSVPTVATVSSTGLVTTVSVGSTVITATADGKSTTQNITVLPPPPVATVTVVPDSGWLPTGIAVPLSATLKDANGGVLSGRTTTWASSNTAIATITNAGVVTALTTGRVTLTATSEGRSGSAPFNAATGLRHNVGQTFGNPTDALAAYAVYVPAGSTQLQVTLRNGTGDPDLYLYRPLQSLASAAACASENGGAVVSETCTITNPAAGVWVVLVYAYETHANTTILATITPTPP